MRILNLYSGIGGNRKLWGDEHEITAVEIEPYIAVIYGEHFPKDKIVIGDAHEYLLEHYREFDFIWSSPPCPTHSKARQPGSAAHPDIWKPVYPDMKLYEEIIFLKHYFDGKYCVENVISYYDPLIPALMTGGHYFWLNFPCPSFGINTGSANRNHYSSLEQLNERKGFKLKKGAQKDTRKLLRNCVEPELGKHILDWSQKEWHHTQKLLTANP